MKPQYIILGLVIMIILAVTTGPTILSMVNRTSETQFVNVMETFSTNSATANTALTVTVKDPSIGGNYTLSPVNALVATAPTFVEDTPLNFKVTASGTDSLSIAQGTPGSSWVSGLDYSLPDTDVSATGAPIAVLKTAGLLNGLSTVPVLFKVDAEVKKQFLLSFLQIRGTTLEKTVKSGSPKFFGKTLDETLTGLCDPGVNSAIEFSLLGSAFKKECLKGDTSGKFKNGGFYVVTMVKSEGEIAESIAKIAGGATGTYATATPAVQAQIDEVVLGISQIPVNTVVFIPKSQSNIVKDKQGFGRFSSMGTISR